MPVKVRCGGCEQVLNVPDKARGKTIACPKCSEKIKVPAGDNAAAPKSTAPVKPAGKAKAKPAQEDTRFLGGLDDYGIEDQNEQICPYCAAPLDEEDEICPGCGRDLSTGQMDKKEAKKRSREGKSSASFYKNVIRESWEFVKEYKSLALRTGMISTFFTVLYMACYFMVTYCEKLPPKYFWVAMTILMAVGTPGWIWFLTRKLVSADLYGEKIDADRIHYDFFTNVALGLAAFLWPCVVSLPLILPVLCWGIFLTVTSSRPEIPAMGMLIGGLSIMALPAIAFPIATIHMTAKHQHKAWIGWELIKLIFKNIGPIFVYHASTFFIVLIFGSIVGASGYFGGNLHLFNNDHVLRWTASITKWMYGLVESQAVEPGSFMFVIVQMPLLFLFAFLFVAPFMILLGFPLLFQMKVNGLIARHFSHSLDLDQRIYPLTPAGFWVRFLAFCTDSLLFPLASFIVTNDKRFVIMGQVLNAIFTLVWFTQGMESVIMQYTVLPLIFFYNRWMYFSVSHAGPVRATLGMEAFGLIAIVDGPNVKQKELDRPMTLGRASLRWICVEISEKLLGLPFLTCAFHPEKKAVHDLLSKTRIVFEGDK